MDTTQRFHIAEGPSINRGFFEALQRGGMSATEINRELSELVARHQTGDWGEVPEVQRLYNESLLAGRQGVEGELVSRFPLNGIWLDLRTGWFIPGMNYPKESRACEVILEDDDLLVSSFRDSNGVDIYCTDCHYERQGVLN